MSGYDSFAEFYDLLTEDVDYPARTEYILSLFQKFDRKPTLLLDVACGTGNFSVQFSKHAIDVIAADPSESMLMSAREKCENILFLNQSAEELDLYGTVDAAVCCLDSLNHICDYDELCRSISRISLFLEPERLFIFDVNTPHKHKNVLADKCYVIETDTVYCVWQNSLENDTLININLDFFAQNKDGSYDRYSDNFFERAYTEKELSDAVCGAGLEIVAIFEDMTENKPNETSQRNYYITRKVK